MTRLESARDVFLAGLMYAHAMEKQALSIMQPQITRRLAEHDRPKIVLERQLALSS